MTMNSEPATGLRDKTETIPQKTAWVNVLLLAILIGVLGIIAGNRLNQSDNQAAAELAPDFDIPLFGGEQRLQLSQYRRQGVVLNFWASWCYPCRQEMPLLESSWRTYRDQGVVFIGVNVWDSEAEAADFLREFEISYPNGIDTDGKVAEAYQLQGIPTTLFIAPDGSINHKVLGPLSPESLAAAVEAIMPD